MHIGNPNLTNLAVCLVNTSHVLVIESDKSNVTFNPTLATTLWNDRRSSLHSPRQRYGGHRTVVLFRQGLEQGMSENSLPGLRTVTPKSSMRSPY